MDRRLRRVTTDKTTVSTDHDGSRRMSTDGFSSVVMPSVIRRCQPQCMSRARDVSRVRVRIQIRRQEKWKAQKHAFPFLPIIQRSIVPHRVHSCPRRVRCGHGHEAMDTALSARPTASTDGVRSVAMPSAIRRNSQYPCPCAQRARCRRTDRWLGGWTDGFGGCRQIEIHPSLCRQRSVGANRSVLVSRAQPVVCRAGLSALTTCVMAAFRRGTPIGICAGGVHQGQRDGTQGAQPPGTRHTRHRKCRAGGAQTDNLNGVRGMRVQLSTRQSDAPQRLCNDVTITA